MYEPFIISKFGSTSCFGLSHDAATAFSEYDPGDR